MTIAYKDFPRINKLPTVAERHREWLKAYEGKVFSMAENSKHLIKWVQESRKYFDDYFQLKINLIKELGNRTRIEFDDKDSSGEKDKEKIAENIEKVIVKLKERGWGYIRSTHNGASDYIWVEFTRKLKPKEKEAFLKWIAPDDSEIDLNFASDKRVFPVLYSPHWKYGTNEMPVEYSKGTQIDFDKISEEVYGRESTFDYRTFIKNEPPTKEELELLRNPNLFNIITKEFQKKIVKEQETCDSIFLSALATYVKNISNKPHLIINGESSVGKSYLVGKVLEMFPPHVYNKKDCYRTRISPRALTYWHNSQVEPEWTWDGKILYLEDIGEDILNCDVFKVMATEGSKATIVGRGRVRGIEIPKTIDIDIIGNPLIIVTTAESIPKNEILNRFSIVDLDESNEQTKNIMEFQLISAITGKTEEYNPLIKNAIAKLKRANVLLLEDLKKIVKKVGNNITSIRLRRDFPRIINLIKASAVLHQYQREKIEIDGEEYILANLKDYNLAKRIYEPKIGKGGGSLGLTHREKKSLILIKEFCKIHKKCNTSEMYSYYPQYTERNWYKILEKLASRGVLIVTQEVNEKTGRKSNFFIPSDQFNEFQLPKINEDELIELNDKKELNELIEQKFNYKQSNILDSNESNFQCENNVQLVQCSFNSNEIEQIEQKKSIQAKKEEELYHSKGYFAVKDFDFVGEDDKKYGFKKGQNVNGLDPKYKKILVLNGLIATERRKENKPISFPDRRKK